jgi:hypothetical protein
MDTRLLYVRQIPRRSGETFTKIEKHVIDKRRAKDHWNVKFVIEGWSRPKMILGFSYVKPDIREVLRM